MKSLVAIFLVNGVATDSKAIGLTLIFFLKPSIPFFSAGGSQAEPPLELTVERTATAKRQAVSHHHPDGWTQCSRGKPGGLSLTATCPELLWEVVSNWTYLGVTTLLTVPSTL